ncbi:hypothetical protein VTK56DRAFT_6066 [Thermocarpiscus australiensis]
MPSSTARGRETADIENKAYRAVVSLLHSKRKLERIKANPHILPVNNDRELKMLLDATEDSLVRVKRSVKGLLQADRAEEPRQRRQQLEDEILIFRATQRELLKYFTRIRTLLRAQMHTQGKCSCFQPGGGRQYPCEYADSLKQRRGKEPEI